MPRRRAYGWCNRCGVALRYQNTFWGRHGGPGRFCRTCWPYVARGHFDLDLPKDWLGAGNGLIKLPVIKPRKPKD